MTFARVVRHRTKILKVFELLTVIFVIFNVLILFKILKNSINKSTAIKLKSGIILEDGLTEDAKRFIKELKLENPGDEGQAVILDKKLLTNEHQKIIKEGWQEYGCNVFISNLISLNRKIPDCRDDYCKQKIYSKNLTKVSIVIIFMNEVLSVLLRTIHSIILNTPWELIEEIILVDDFSDREHLKEPLEEYCEKLKKVKIIRSHKRLGVASARVFGFRNAKGPIIMSLDSHVEMMPGWLEPHLDRLKDNPMLVTSVNPKVLDSDTFESKFDDNRALVGFDVNLEFFELDIESYEPHLNYWEPHKSPIFYGYVFGFWKKFGERIGYIDIGTSLFGGDDLDFALRTWFCGGSIETIPCSTVLHLPKVRVYSLYDKDKGEFYYKDRIVESWFDDNYKKFYYRLNGDTKNRNFGDISENLKVKEELNCKSFSWYVENVFLDFQIPEELKD